MDGKRKPSKDVAHYKDITIGEQVFKVNDDVLLKAPKSGPSYVARILDIRSDAHGAVEVKCRWYYRPEETPAKRQPYHGSRELFLSNHFDWQTVEALEGHCRVLSIKDYVQLKPVGDTDFYSRFHYNIHTEKFSPDRLPVYCSCEQPFNPDAIMVRCVACDDWFHPQCVRKTKEELDKIKVFRCPLCLEQEGNGKDRAGDRERDERDRAVSDRNKLNKDSMLADAALGSPLKKKPRA